MRWNQSTFVAPLLAVCSLPCLQAKVDFSRQVRPILSDACFACHGPDEKNRMAGLRLDQKEGLLQVVKAGKHADSKLFQRISHDDSNRRMPPKNFSRTLSKEQVALVGKWIDEGAEWQTHWSYAAVSRPEPPQVKAANWVRNPIDRFVLARLQKEGLKPAPEAGKATLLRRVTLDLTGLPPTKAEVQAFLADKSPDAYERVVDRLLASPHYGERMAMQWLDLSRYADTHGYHIDSHRDMWPWRDWVIRAFNTNMRFDQFAVAQLAGDLLPNATSDQKLATGFNRNHMINFEGGAIPEEYLMEYIVDRVETTAVTFMGMTMGCARCHDHKYDPISQRDFYGFYAFFNSIDEKGLDGREGNAKPMLALPDDAEKARLKKLEAAIAERKALLPDKEIDAAVDAWSQRTNLSFGSPAAAHYELDGSLSDSSGNYRHARAIRGNFTFSSSPANQGINFDGETQIEWAKSKTPENGFTASFWLRWGNKLEQAFLHKFDPATQRGIIIRMEEGFSIGDLKRGTRIHLRVANHWPDNALEVRTQKAIVQGEWTHITVTYHAKLNSANIYINGKSEPLEVIKDALKGSFETDVPWGTGDKKVDSPSRAQIDELRFFERSVRMEEAEEFAVEATLRSILLIPSSKRTRDQKERLRHHYLTNFAMRTQRDAYAGLDQIINAKANLEKQIVTSMVMEESEKPRDTFVLARGDYRNKTDKVTAAVPASLPPLPAGVPANRLGLARWLVDPSHPLTARVAVNRYWQLYFGAGLVDTSEDFGSQGAPPTHPELLDWLASQFVESGWDVKAMQRLIVTSATYRQTSQATPSLIERDPQNRLLARMSRFRLPAEMVRDNALAVSGMLNTRIGGKSVFPYQPPGLWEEMAYGDVYSAQTYQQSRGPDLYRRSMYTFWKRTVPPAQMSTFDAPDREKCVARRARTNTPLQALVLMNDPTYIEAARTLAAKAMATGKDANSRVRAAFELAAARPPNSSELKLLTSLAARQQRVYKSQPESAAKLLAVGESKPAAGVDIAELAAWTTVASAILNLDEVISKE
ncbi:MAG: DUF1553 domain-containing protein [Acidobacteria bacterium]|nr:DUF1553 domain-containing protein [Acidobacteriota bacterium]